jgi:hypothetical protein
MYYIDQSRIVHVESFPLDVRVTEGKHMGFNVDPDGFHFGRVPRGAMGNREISIAAQDDVRVHISPRGKISSWLSYPDNILIAQGNTRNITLTIIIPEDAEIGTYNGTVTFILKKA